MVGLSLFAADRKLMSRSKDPRDD